MKKIFKKVILAIILMLGITFATPQNALAKGDPFGDKGWICAGTKDFNITLFRDGTIWIVIYNDDGTVEAGIYDPNTGRWYSNHWTENH